MIVKKSAFVSTEGLDRYGHIVSQKGINIDAYLENNVVFYNHKSDKLLGNAIGLQKTEKGLVIEGIDFVDYHENHEYAPLAKQFEDGRLKAFSVGLLVNRESIERTEKGLVINESELYELSLVTVPANKEAVVKLFEVQSDGEVIELSLDKLQNLNLSTHKSINMEKLEKDFADLQAQNLVLEKSLSDLKADVLAKEKAFAEKIEWLAKGYGITNTVVLKALQNATNEQEILDALELGLPAKKQQVFTKGAGEGVFTINLGREVSRGAIEHFNKIVK